MPFSVSPSCPAHGSSRSGYLGFRPSAPSTSSPAGDFCSSCSLVPYLVLGTKISCRNLLERLRFLHGHKGPGEHIQLKTRLGIINHWRNGTAYIQGPSSHQLASRIPELREFLLVERDSLTQIFHALISCQYFDAHAIDFNMFFFVSELMVLWLLRIFVLSGWILSPTFSVAFLTPHNIFRICSLEVANNITSSANLRFVRQS